MGGQTSATGEKLSVEGIALVIFDVDGTLIKGTSCEKLFFHHLLDKKILRIKHLLNFCFKGISLIPSGKSHIISANKGYLRGFEVDYIDKLGKEHFSSYMKNIISKKGIDKIHEHKKNGEKIALLSGMPEFLLKNFSNYLEIDFYFGSVLKINNGKYTGDTEGVFPLGRGKAKIVEKIVSENNLLWSDLTAYADHYLDRFLLRKVGKPVAVNPDDRLKRIAETDNWAIEIFD